MGDPLKIEVTEFSKGLELKDPGYYAHLLWESRGGYKIRCKIICTDEVKNKPNYIEVFKKRAIVDFEKSLEDLRTSLNEYFDYPELSNEPNL